MGIRFGNFDPLGLTFNIMNVLMKKNAITYDEAVEIIRLSLPPEMPEEEKKKIVTSMVRRNPPQ